MPRTSWPSCSASCSTPPTFFFFSSAAFAQQSLAWLLAEIAIALELHSVLVTLLVTLLAGLTTMLATLLVTLLATTLVALARLALLSLHGRASCPPYADYTGRLDPSHGIVQLESLNS